MNQTEKDGESTGACVYVGGLSRKRLKHVLIPLILFPTINLIFPSL